MKKITRKEFLKKSGAGIAALGLMPSIKATTSNASIPRRKLGNTGIMVSELCFGASRTRDEGLIRYAIDRGMNMLDTGRSYANGNNEKLVGRVIKDKRNDIIVQSKMYLEESELNAGGKGKKGASEIRDILSGRLEESLKALDTDYIDIMLYHSAELEHLVYHDAVLKFYDEQKASGVIRAHGFSSHDYELNILKRNNREKFYDVIMHPFNYSGSFIHSLSGWSARWDQEVLIAELTEASRLGTAIIAMKSCSAGPCARNGKEASFAQSVAWVLDHQFISSAAVAMSSFEQVDEHISNYLSFPRGITL